MKHLARLLIALSSLLCPTVTFAQWQLDGFPLAAVANDQGAPAIIPDGAGGAIVAYHDYRSGGSYDVYAQRINNLGAAQWTSGGVALCTAAVDQVYPLLVPDGAGGAIAVWSDSRSGTYDLYAQRINASGVVQWTANGVVITNAAGFQYYPAIVSDGAGGAIIAWQDQRSGNYDVYAQRVNAAGVVQWTANGVPVLTAAGDQYATALVGDGAGGVIIAWQDNSDVYAERVNASGSLLWVFPTVVCNATGVQMSPAITTDGAAGAIVTWQDQRSGNFDVYIQRVNASGVTQWTANGLVIGGAPNDQLKPMIVSDGAAGAIVTWQDFRSGNYDVYAQHVGAPGNPLWTWNGLALSTFSGDQQNPAPVADGTGGVIVSWEDNRVGPVDVYAQKVNAAGATQWAPDGTPACAAAQGQTVPRVVSDGSGGGVFAWQDGRSGQFDVYAQRLEGRYGYWGRPEPILDVVKDNKNDQGGKVVLNWRSSGRDFLYQQTIYSYSIWRALDVAPAQAMLASGNATAIDTPSSKKANAKGRTLWIERSPATSYYWELVGSQVANFSEAYSFLASTRQDSTAASAATTQFRVVAEGSNQFITWPSNVLSGRSVDNLAPEAPLFLTAQRVASDVHLKWNRVHVSDLKNYSVYRKTSSGVTPIPANFLAAGNDTVLVDASAPTSALYYIVTATDVHANQGEPSNEAAVSATTNAGNLPPITALTVLQNRPNPFTTQTRMEIGLPAAGSIHIDVYDVAGRRVRGVELQGVKGWQEIALAGTNQKGEPLASGVYFYKIHAGDETLTRKMVIAR